MDSLSRYRARCHRVKNSGLDLGSVIWETPTKKAFLAQRAGGFCSGGRCVKGSHPKGPRRPQADVAPATRTQCAAGERPEENITKKALRA
jgi:hypothetical protein